MALRVYVLALVACLILVETCAQMALEAGLSGAVSSARLAYVAGVVAYAAVGVLYGFLLRTGKEMGVANALWNAGTGVTVVGVGFLVFKQSLSLKNSIGVLLALASVGFLA